MSLNRPWIWAGVGVVLLVLLLTRSDSEVENKLAAKAEDKTKSTDWPNYRGSERTGVSKESGLLKEWPKDGPKLLFQTDKAGLGLAGMAVVGGKIYTMGARGDDEYAIALDEKGKEIWSTKLGPVHDWKANTFSRGPNATPTVDGDLVFCLSSKGMLKAVAKKDGKEEWKVDLVADMGGEVNGVGGGIEKLGWGFSWSPLVDGDQLIITPGGAKGLIAGLDKKTGKELWRSKGIAVDSTYSTPVLATVGGVKQVITIHQKGVVGVSAKDGEVLWKYDRDDKYPDVVCPSPIVSGDRVYVSVGYGPGQISLQLTPNGKKFDVKQMIDDDNLQKLGNRVSGVVQVDKHVFGYHEERGWVCVEFATGKPVWPRGKRQTVKAGGMVVADGRIYVVDEQGTIAMLAASTKGYNLISSFELPPPAPSKNRKARGAVWTYPSLCDGKLYVRDQELIFCYEVK